ncbi:conserved unknown protein [Ectocarpus siliculosus]|uniref:Uncharacterized protein n=1 Tax=Ectocarpus siliculosus TaxID=2880 RepID=D7FHZ8_ECTSI|nr:conserved unknown protein [Ectocarpus siliculosus]|eukprot:CBJ49009.1 conserved unknown protein [Ectocarpus siliculosus]
MPESAGGAARERRARRDGPVAALHSAVLGEEVLPYSSAGRPVFSGHQNDLHSELDACFTPSVEYVLPGSEGSGIYAWCAEGGKLTKILKGHSSAVGRVLLVGPKYEVMASVRTHTALWMDAGLEPGQQAVGIHPGGGVSLSLGALHYAFGCPIVVLLSTPREHHVITWRECCWISSHALNSLSRMENSLHSRFLSLFSRKLLYGSSEKLWSLLLPGPTRLAQISRTYVHSEFGRVICNAVVCIEYHERLTEGRIV